MSGAIHFESAVASEVTGMVGLLFAVITIVLAGRSLCALRSVDEEAGRPLLPMVSPSPSEDAGAGSPDRFQLYEDVLVILIAVGDAVAAIGYAVFVVNADNHPTWCLAQAYLQQIGGLMSLFCTPLVIVASPACVW